MKIQRIFCIFLHCHEEYVVSIVLEHVIYTEHTRFTTFAISIAYADIANMHNSICLLTLSELYGVVMPCKYPPPPILPPCHVAAEREREFYWQRQKTNAQPCNYFYSLEATQLHQSEEIAQRAKGKNKVFIFFNASQISRVRPFMLNES